MRSGKGRIACLFVLALQRGLCRIWRLKTDPHSQRVLHKSRMGWQAGLWRRFFCGDRSPGAMSGAKAGGARLLRRMAGRASPRAQAANEFAACYGNVLKHVKATGF